MECAFPDLRQLRVGVLVYLSIYHSQGRNFVPKSGGYQFSFRGGVDRAPKARESRRRGADGGAWVQKIFHYLLSKRRILVDT